MPQNRHYWQYVLEKCVTTLKKAVLKNPDDFEIKVIGNYHVECMPRSNDVSFEVDLQALEDIYDGAVALLPFQGPTKDKGVACLSAIGQVEGCAVLIRIFYGNDSVYLSVKDSN